MKTRYINHIVLTTMILSIAIPGFLFGQTTLKEGENKISQRVYVVKKMVEFGGSLHIDEKNNTIAAAIEADPVGLARIGKIEYTGDGTIAATVLKTLGEARIRELWDNGEKTILINIYIDHSGQVGGVRFGTSGDTKIWLEEIDRLTTALKRDVSIKIPPGLDSAKSIVPITYVANFGRLLEKR